MNRFVVKKLPYILLLFGFILGAADYLLDKYIPNSFEWVVWASNTFILMCLGFRVGKFIKNMYEKVYRDDLTGLLNRGYFYFRLNFEIEKINDKKSYLSLIMVDIDNFKLINDEYGHLEGDKVIKDVAGILRESTSKNDCAIRWGGDEFALILPDTDAKQAYDIADYIRSIVESKEYCSKGISYKTTVSIGIYTINEKFSSDKFLAMTDAALYKAKVKKNSIAVVDLGNA